MPPIFGHENFSKFFEAKINQEMEPYKKQNKQLMSIIGAAEKGHNLLLNTMQSINSEIAGNFWININLLFMDYGVLSLLQYAFS